MNMKGLLWRFYVLDSAYAPLLSYYLFAAEAKADIFRYDSL